jgi:hypothetical protein
MKKYLIVILCCVSFNLMADPCQGVYGPYGPVQCDVGTSNALSANGPVIMEGTTVLGSTNINGTLNADHSVFNALQVNGTVVLKNSIVQGKTQINGTLFARKSWFNQLLTLASNSVVFEDTQSVGIAFLSTSSSPKIMVLAGSSRVNGNISFKDKDGIVCMSQTAQIVGSIIGGQRLVYQNATERAQCASTGTITSAAQ